MLQKFKTWIAGRFRRELACPGCRVINVVHSRVGDEIECGACGERFWHGRRPIEPIRGTGDEA